MIQARFDVERSVDVWSLGCVFSEAATWSVHGWERLLEYRRRRRKELQDVLGSGAGDAFHDGSRVLITVVENHKHLMDDYLIPEIITLISNMLVDSEERLTSRLAYQKSLQVIQRAKEKILQAGNQEINPWSTSASTTLVDETSVATHVLEHYHSKEGSPLREDQIVQTELCQV